MNGYSPDAFRHESFTQTAACYTAGVTFVTLHPSIRMDGHSASLDRTLHMSMSLRAASPIDAVPRHESSPFLPPSGAKVGGKTVRFCPTPLPARPSLCPASALPVSFPHRTSGWGPQWKHATSKAVLKGLLPPHRTRRCVCRVSPVACGRRRRGDSHSAVYRTIRAAWRSWSGEPHRTTLRVARQCAIARRPSLLLAIAVQ